MIPKTHFGITIQTKAYLKKYLHALYGDPLYFTSDNYFGVCLYALLDRPVTVTAQANDTILRRRLDTFDVPMEIQLPVAFLKKSRGGYSITDEHTIILNKLFETRFEEDLLKWCELGTIYKVEFKKSIEEFCWRHRISLEEDISYESLRKKECRFRKKKEASALLIAPLKIAS